MDAAAMTCTAHPQSIDATDAMVPMVFEYPTIQASKFLHLGDDKECVQKYKPPDVGAAEPNSAIDIPMQRIKRLATAQPHTMEAGPPLGTA
jgi:hypothetical protein